MHRRKRKSYQRARRVDFSFVLIQRKLSNLCFFSIRNVTKLESLNKELEQHVEDVDEQIELANTQVIVFQRWI